MAEGKDESRKKQDQLRTRSKMMDLLARRDHSEREIRRKLKDKHEPDDIEAAVEYGKEKGWIPSDAVSQTNLSERMAEMLHRKSKGIQYINHYLAEKGLPPVESQSDRELAKARELIEAKFKKTDLRDRTQQGKAGRFLASRGFTMDIIRQVVFKRD